MLFMCLNFFIYKNLCVDTVNLTVPMDLSGIPWIFIYLLFMRGSLTYYITRPHFFGLRLWHVKAHGDLGATSLLFSFKTKEYSVEFIQCFNFFLVFWLCVCILFVYNNQCVDKVYLTTPMDLEYHGYLYICYSWGVPWYIAQHVHIFCGCVCDISRTMVTWVHLIYHIFLNTKANSTHKGDMMKCLYTSYSFWGKPSLESSVWRSLYACYIHDLVFIWQCRVFETMDMTNIIEVATAVVARTRVVCTLKKWFLWFIYKNK
jgi:hypothetical protein